MLVTYILPTENLRQTYNSASKDMEFRVNTTSWRLIALAEFLFNKQILNFCKLMVCKFKGKEMHQTISLNINCTIIGEYAPEEILVDNYVSFFFFLTGTHSIQG